MENIKDLLTIPYNQDNYKKFSTNFLKEFESVPLTEIKEIPSAFKGTIESYTIFGRYSDPENNKIIVLSVKVKNNSDAQKSQRQFVSYLLTNDFIDYNAAMVAYYDNVRKNWKLSFVTVEYSFGDKGLELKFQPSKRFSFLVGQDEPSKTYVQQLSPIYIANNKPTLSMITDAFSVSRLSKDFYEDYKKKYFELFDYLSNNDEFKKESIRLGYDDIKKFATTFCKKTLGQVVFLHFIQKKGWLGVLEKWGDGDKQYLINSAINFNDNNYFNDFLEPLFYNGLNVKRKNDSYLGKKIPFLNGGLFHPIEDYNWEKTNFDIPNGYWLNDNETGLLNILHQYNFTVDEADPNEQEVAIDPEMLGKIFESLLDTNDRSSLGAFYTPREIVHFMCEESLATRLSKALNMDYDSILNFVRYGDALKETKFIEKFASDIDDYVSHFTIIDPAVGSGAFLVGMLNQIVKLRTDLQKYTEKTISKYQMKLEAIQNCLYGVDIEFDAVEIAKLRLWLSLVVDQETEFEVPNPLPNLNFHLRVGNSLVDTIEGIKLWSSNWRGSKKKAKAYYQMNLLYGDAIEVVLERLKQAKKDFFNTSNEEEKRKLLKNIEDNQVELIRYELYARDSFSTYNKIEAMKKKKTKPFFIWELEFEEVFENGGFDIVIANPPYIQLQKDGGRLADELKDQGYETFNRMGDIYCIFYEKGMDLLKDEGILSYITSNKWMRAGYGEKLRGFLANNSNPIKLIDFGGNKIFESATVDVNILIASKEKNKEKTMAVTAATDCSINLSDYFEQNYYINSFVNSDSWVLLNKIEISIKDKIEKYGTPLSEWNISINYGIKTGYNDAFIIDEATKNMLIESDPKSAELIRPILRGRDIKRYCYDFAKLWVIYIPYGFTNQNRKGQNPEERFKTTYPSIYYHLVNVENELSKTRNAKSKGLYKRDDQGEYWWELRSCKYLDDFYKPKIMYNDINTRLSFCYVEEGVFCNNTVYFLQPNELDLKYFLAVLNSHIINWYYKTISVQLGSNAVRMFSIYVKNIPIPRINNQDKIHINNLVNKALSQDNIDAILDQIIYQLFHLTKSEIEYINKI